MRVAALSIDPAVGSSLTRRQPGQANERSTLLQLDPALASEIKFQVRLDQVIQRKAKEDRQMQNDTAHALAVADIMLLGTAFGSVGRGDGKGSVQISSDAYNVGRGGGK